MARWDELKATLMELRQAEPRPLRSSPSIDGDENRQPPFSITLAPWATDVAQDLHDRFGPDVDLVVGVFGFPEGQLRRVPTDVPAAPELDPGALDVELAGPLAVDSGHDARHGLRITNRAAWAVVLETNGGLTAQVVDPRTGAVVGGFAGWQTQPLVRFPIEPGQTVTVPLLVGTASFDPDLGFAIPPGEWAIVAPLHLDDGQSVRTPPLTITVR